MGMGIHLETLQPLYHNPLLLLFQTTEETSNFSTKDQVINERYTALQKVVSLALKKHTKRLSALYLREWR